MATVIDAFPSFLNRHVNLTIDQRKVEVRFTSAEWQGFWRPFLTKLAEARTGFPRRMLVAVAGPPGTGKSMFAEQLNWLLNNRAMPGVTAAAALSQDGFHYDGYYLKSHSVTLAGGEQIPMSQVKGSAGTFDAAALKKHIEMLRANTSDVGWPGYDRTEHETVPNRFRVPQQASIVVVEGTYVLVDSGAYAGIAALFDLKIFLDTSGSRIISGLIERHVSGGKSVEQAKAWVKRVDLPNAQLIMGSKARADVIITRNDDDELENVTWRSAAAAV